MVANVNTYFIHKRVPFIELETDMHKYLFKILIFRKYFNNIPLIKNIRSVDYLSKTEAINRLSLRTKIRIYCNKNIKHS